MIASQTQPLATELVEDDFEDLPTGEGGPEDVHFDIIANIASPNLAFEIDEVDVAKIGRVVVDEYQLDLESRKAAGWDERNEEAIKLAMQVREDKTFPWVGAANIKYPLITTAAIQFAARAYPAVVDGWNVVKGKVLGKPDDQKRDRADRIAAHMSFQLLEEMPEWEEDTDQMLHVLPITGMMVRKTWFDPVLGRNRSEIIFPDKIVVDYYAKADCARITQVVEYQPHEVLERVRSGVWADITLEQHQDSNERECFLEQHRLWDMDGDGYPEPYIVTVHRDTAKVVRIVARYDEDGVRLNAKDEVISITPTEYFTRYPFIPSMDGSWYAIGFGALLNSLSQTINATINQLLDAGTLANTQGGFIGDGVKLKSGNASFRPGEWKKVANDAGSSLKDNIVPLPVGAPSTVLFSLLGMMVEAAKDITATKDILTGETQQTNQPVGTTLAMIEQGLKVFTAIYKRVHRSLKKELAQLYRLNRLYLEPETYFTFQDDERVVRLDDYRAEGVDVIPVSDPTIVTDTQRIGRAQFLITTFRGDPTIDQRELNRRVLEAASIADIDELMPEPKGPPPPPPEVIKAMADADAKTRETAIDEKRADAEIANTLADAEAKVMQSIMTNPALYELVRQLVRQDPNGSGEVPGMGQQPVDPGSPQGPAPAADGMVGQMGPGDGPVPGDAGQGGPVGPFG